MRVDPLFDADKEWAALRGGFLTLETARVQIGWKRRLKEKQLGNGEGKKKKMRMEKEIC